MGTQEVMEQLAVLAGLDEREIERYWPLGESARVQVASLAKPEIGMKGERALRDTAAALAFYRWTLLHAALGEESSFTAGDVRVTKNKTDVATARQFWREAEAAASPYLNDEGFVFEQM